MIVGSQLDRVVPKLFTKVVKPVVKASGICKASQLSISKPLHFTKSHVKETTNKKLYLN